MPVENRTVGEAVLTPGDLVEICFGVEVERTLRTRIEADGTVGLPYLTGVKIGGLSPAQAETAIRNCYAPTCFHEVKVQVTLIDHAIMASLEH